MVFLPLVPGVLPEVMVVHRQAAAQAAQEAFRIRQVLMEILRAAAEEEVQDLFREPAAVAAAIRQLPTRWDSSPLVRESLSLSVQVVPAVMAEVMAGVTVQTGKFR